MIVKDEAEVLERSLSSVSGFVDEMIVVDTGSTDDTKRIARYMGAKIFDFEWVDDFSAARNFALAQATGDWILQLDADEELVSGKEEIRQAVADEAMDMFLLQIVVAPDAESAESGEYGAFYGGRLFRRRPELQYRFPIHEHVILPDETRAAYFPYARIIHFGPGLDDAGEQGARSGRNLRILRSAVERDASSAYLQSKLAAELMHTGEYAEALPHFEAAEADGTSVQSQFMPPTMRNHADTLRRLGRLDEALNVLSAARTLYPAYPDLPFLEGEVLLQMDEKDKARSCYEDALRLGDAPPGMSSWGGTGGALAQGRLKELSQADAEPDAEPDDSGAEGLWIE